MSQEWRKGEPYYEVKWKGYDASSNTVEPTANLVGASEGINDFNKQLEAQEKAHREKIAEARAARRKEREQERLTQQKAALDQLVDSVGPQDSDTESGDGLPGILCIR